jgi:UDP-N-acetylmuramoylalanine--D-glutamate ligase
MRPDFGWRDLRDVGRVGVWGLGVEGRANVSRLAALGVKPVLVDDRPRHEAVVATDNGGLELLTSCEVIIKSPGISRYREDVAALEKKGVPVVGGLGLWLNDVEPAKVICVTGTKGKSTTVSIAGHLARNLGANCFVGGNLGTPPYHPDVPTDFDLWVIEVSSYQATDVAITPPVVGVTSLYPDHLDWHRGTENYFRDKLSLTSQAGASLTVCGEDEQLRRHSAHLGPRVHWIGPSAVGPWWRSLGLIGRHNAVNAGIAASLLCDVGVTGAENDARLEAAAEGFRGLGSRLEFVSEVAGVEFYDDSLATNVLPTMAAIDVFADRHVAIILGGFDRGVDYTPLASHLAVRDSPTLALTVPDNGERIAEALESGAQDVEVVRCVDIAAAVTRGFEWAKPLGVVLLSPAAPSFGQFTDYRDRAVVFRRAALACEQS